MYYVYVLKSSKDKKLYIGYTTNLKQRLEQHKAGGSISTKKEYHFVVFFMKHLFQKKMRQEERDILKLIKARKH